jgi:hypothetical protein
MADGSSVMTADETANVMGPSLLALQPVTPRKTPQRMSFEWNIAYSKLEARMLMLRAWRFSWWTYWSSLAAYFNPRRYLWLVVANRQWRGSSINDQIIDSTGLQAVRTAAAGMWTGLTSPSRPWFSLDIAGPEQELDADAKAWIEDTQTKAYAVLAQSNFYSIMAQAFEDVVVFGTAPVVMYEDYTNVIRLYLPAAGEYYLGVGPDLSTDTFYREFTYTVVSDHRPLAVENCPPRSSPTSGSRAARSLETEFVVAHSSSPTSCFPTPDTEEIDSCRASSCGARVYWLRNQQTEQPLEVRWAFRRPAVVRGALGHGRQRCLWPIAVHGCAGRHQAGPA